MKSQNNDGHLSTFQNVTISPIIHNNEDIKLLVVGRTTTTVRLLQATYIFESGYDTLKVWGMNVNKK